MRIDIVNKISAAVERYRDDILAAEKYLWKIPEPAYREVKTSKYLADAFAKLGYELNMAGNIPGFYTVIDTGRPGPGVLVLAEMDAVTCPDHKYADPETGAAHACGHHGQCATLIGVAAALKEPGMLDGMSGKIFLCAVPAEETISLSKFVEFKKAQKIKYPTGKCEFLHRGYFDGVDLAFMVHIEPMCKAIRGMNGSMMKRVTYKGRTAHASGHPELGANALYAANCGINAVNALRETFIEPEYLRVASAILFGGATTDTIPDRIMVEYKINGRSYASIVKASEKIDRALCGAAFSLGINIEIETFPFRSPLDYDKGMIEVFREAAALVMPGEPFDVTDRIGTGSTDLGDLSRIMPVVHPGMRGDRGSKHTPEYEMIDPEAACVTNAKWQIMALNLLLGEGGRRAEEIVRAYKPEFTSKEALLSFIDSLEDSGDRITYHDDGSAEIRIRKSSGKPKEDAHV